jgi:hypothetical protein
MASKYNRREEYTLDEVLGAFRELSHAGHPHDYIDADTAKIALRRPRKGPNAGKTCIVISWAGMDQDDPDYQRA